MSYEAVAIFMAVIAIALLALIAAIPSGRTNISRRDWTMSRRSKLAMHETRTRLNRSLAKNEIRSNAARIRRDIDRDLRKAPGCSSN
jgi:hypothetical protein